MTLCELTVRRLLHVNNGLEGGAGEGVRLPARRRPRHLLPERLRQAALQELFARSELLVVLGGFGAAVVEDGDHGGRLPSALVLSRRRPFGGCEGTRGAVRLDFD